MYFTDQGVPLCEKPSWGQGWSRCKFIGISGACLKFSEPLIESPGGWAGRCSACATSGYLPRGLETTERTRPPLKKLRKFTDLFAVRRMAAEGSAGPKDVLLALMARAVGEVTKASLLETASRFYWKGWASGAFISHGAALRKAFEELCAEGLISYTKGKPLHLNEKLK